MLPLKNVNYVLPDVLMVLVQLEEFVMLENVKPITWKAHQLLVRNVLITVKNVLTIPNVKPVILVILYQVPLVLNVMPIVQHVLLKINVLLVVVIKDID